MTLVYLDTETTGLDPDLHSVWEIAYAVEDGPILSSFVAHSTEHADPKALEMNGYFNRFAGQPLLGLSFSGDLRRRLEGSTLVAANARFDAAFLRRRWGVEPFKFRLLDIEAYAMGALRYREPQGLAKISDDLRERGFDIPQADHTAAADVAALRACHQALQSIYEEAMR